MSEAPQELDAIAAALARRADQRELAERAPEWEALAAGELELEQALTRRRAAGDDDEELARAAEYFRPFDADESNALVDGLLGGLVDAEVGGDEQGEGRGEDRDADQADQEGAGGTDEGADQDGDEAGDQAGIAELIPLAAREPASAGESEPAKPKHDPGSSGFWWIPGGMLATAAAAILIWWVWPPNEAVRGLDGGRPELAVVEPLPDYVLETDGGLKQVRGGETGETGETGEKGETGAMGATGPGELSHRYRRETEFEWVLRPRVDAAGEVAVRGFAFVDGGSAGLPLASLAELGQIAESGAIRITGTVEQLDLEPGRYTIALAVGRPADLPTQAAELFEPAADAAWQVRRIEIEIEG